METPIPNHRQEQRQPRTPHDGSLDSPSSTEAVRDQPVRDQSGTESRAFSLREKRSLYLPVRSKFLISTVFSVLWFYVSWNLAQPWLQDLGVVVGYTPAVVIIFFIALLPGFLNAHILSSVLLDRPPPPRFDINFPPVSLLIAAYNEADNIAETVRGINSQDYSGKVEIIVVDDGSTDRTVDVLQSFNLTNLKIVQANHGGKARALNEGLKHVSTEIVVCIDADTY